MNGQTSRHGGVGSHLLMLIFGLLLGLSFFVGVRANSQTELVITSVFGVSFGMIPVIIVVFYVARRIERSHHELMRDIERKPVPPVNNYAAMPPPMLLQLPPPVEAKDKSLAVARPLHTAPVDRSVSEETVDWRLL